MTPKKEGPPGKGGHFGSFDRARKQSTPKEYPNRPSKKSLRAARLHDAPLHRPKVTR
jgi:hypothetical protein